MNAEAIAKLITQRREELLERERARIAENEECTARYLTVLEALEILAEQLSLPEPELLTTTNGEVTGIRFDLASIHLDLSEYNTIIWSDLSERPQLVASIAPHDIMAALINYFVSPRIILATGEQPCPTSQP